MLRKTILALTISVLFQVSFCFKWQIDDLTVPEIVIETMAAREMRYHHFLWHNLRDNWLNLDASTQHAIAKCGWAPPRPSAFYRDNGDQIVMEENDSGEDFLYMHRQMVILVNKLVAGTPYGKVTGWSWCPAPGDTKWPVPEPYELPGDPGFTATITRAKTDDFFFNVMQPMEEDLNDEDNMRAWSLGKFGAKIEFTVHNWLHMRFSELHPEIGARPPTASPSPNIDSKYDDPDYRWLGDTYGSHVNPVFWRIHGWVDNKIEQWRKANGLDNITWKGTWEGGPMETIEDLFVAGSVNDSDTDDGDGEYEPSEEVLTAMSQVVAIMLRQDVTNHFKNTQVPKP